MLDALARDPKLRTLYLYPTKALAQDQARGLAEFRLPRVRPAIYDGDTPGERRWQIRKWANLILTNPDMLHVGVLPHHDRWGDVLSNLRYVVVDEAHVYRGVFGSHVANVLRRLRRLARAYGSEPQFLLATATIANPAELVRALTGLEAQVIDDDGAPRAERTICVWNPPLLDEELGLRASALGDAAKLQAELVGRGLRTLTFAKSRRSAELIHRFTAQRLDGGAGRLSPYRAGYTPEQRREIERRLAEGELLGVSATNALELGIDVGMLDAVVSVGFPGTVASLRQQWGRAGPPRPRARRPRRERGRARPVLRPRAGRAAAAAGRGGEARPREPARPRRPRPRSRVRGPGRRRRPRDPRRRGARAGRGAPRPAQDADGLRLGRAATTRPRACRSARRARTASRSSTSRPARCSASRSASGPSRPSTRARSTSTSASRTSCASSTSSA